MADIKKCDICGKIYEGKKHPLVSGTYCSTVNVLDYGDYTDRAIENRSYDRYDTCPACTNYIKHVIKCMKIKAAEHPDLILPMSQPENPCDCRRCRKRRKEARAK